MMCTAAILLLMTVGAYSQHEGSPEDWYQTYAVYPEYCSTIEQMENRKIPPLVVGDSLTGGSKLKQVTVLTRHGARSPEESVHCWEGYLEDPETAVWDCDLTSIKAPLSESQINQRQGKDIGDASPFTLDFDVKYDAQEDPEGVVVNLLGGNCMAGQLIMRGHEQMKQSGENLREAYTFNASTANGELQGSGLNLIDISGQRDLPPWDESNLRFRSTDKQRTILSGQTLLRSMFQPEIDTFVAETQTYPSMALHTADIDNESMLPNFGLCPLLATAAAAPEQTPGVAAEKSTEEDLEELIYFIDQVLGGDVEHFGIDCLMTTMCSDRPLHDAINDFTGDDMDNGYFQRILDMYTNQYVSMMTKNDAVFSKLAMGPLWLEIMSNLVAFENDQEEVCCPTRPRSKLALYAGHDLTLMPFLASIGLLGDEWVTFAASIVIELHEVGTNNGTTTNKDDSIFETNHAFRLLYNGKVMTPEIQGCPANLDLCDFKVLVELIDSFATNYEDCYMPPTEEEEEEEEEESISEEVEEEEDTNTTKTMEETATKPPTDGVRGSTSGAIGASPLVYSMAVAFGVWVLGMMVGL